MKVYENNENNNNMKIEIYNIKKKIYYIGIII